jgi:hypothetical protein
MAALPGLSEQRPLLEEHDEQQRNQLNPLRFLPCAMPALMNASVPHPIAYSGG